MLHLRSLAIFAALAWMQTAAALEVGGIRFDDKIRLDAASADLVANGGGFRTRFFIKVYAAVLYLPEKKSSAAEVLTLPGAKRMLLHVVRDGLSGKQMADAMTDALMNNLSASEQQSLKARVDEFRALMTAQPDSRSGTLVSLDYLPNTGTVLSVGGLPKGAPIAGEDLYRGLLKIWLGEHPVEASLKKELLGAR